jgi:colanic acid biosynthesis glycosyl transferase WcaI
MRILVLSKYYIPEIAAPCFRIADHARTWIEQGHDVTVVTCAPHFPRGRVYEGYRNRLYQEEMIDGVKVVRLWTFTAANEGVVKRILNYLSFMFMSIVMCWKYPKFDVCIATSGPFFTAVAGFFVSILRRRPWIFEIRDLWPASVASVGAIKGWPIRLLEKVELFLYRRSHRIVSLTNSFKQNLVDRGIDSDKNDVITNGVDLERFCSDLPPEKAREQLGIEPDAFLLGYIGTIGMAHGLRTVLDAASALRDQPIIQFVFIGDGAERKGLEQYAAKLKLTNVTFSDYVPHDQIPAYLSALDMSVVHLKPDPLFRTVIPSKIFESMAVGTPILMAVQGESAEIVADTGSGFCIPPGDAQTMAQTIRELESNRFRLASMSHSGRDAVAARYSREASAVKFLNSMRAAIATWNGDSIPQIRRNQTPVTAERRKAA